MTICRNILQQKLAFPTSLKDVKAKDLVRKLLARDAGRRLGMIKGGGEAIKHQRWYSEHHKLDFDKLDAQTPEMDAWVPWVPKCKDKVGASTPVNTRLVPCSILKCESFSQFDSLPSLPSPPLPSPTYVRHVPTQQGDISNFDRCDDDDADEPYVDDGTGWDNEF